MSTQAVLAVVTGTVGLISAGMLALINSAISARAGIDETLRSKRLETYPKLWGTSGAVSRWPRLTVTFASLEDLHKTLRSWYYTDGGLFLSEMARARYGDVQELTAALLKHGGDPADVLTADRYADLMKTSSALRTALTDDLQSRRRPSSWEKRRRRRWHVQAAQAAHVRIQQAITDATPFTPVQMPVEGQQ